MILTLAYQGGRITATINTLRKNVDWRAGIVDRFVGKSQKWRRSAVAAEVLAAWKALPENADGLIFTLKDRHEVYDAIDALNLPFRYRPHMSRRGFAIALKDLGYDHADIGEAGDWEDPKSVRAYVPHDVNRQRRTLQGLRGKVRGKIGKAS